MGTLKPTDTRGFDPHGHGDDADYACTCVCAAVGTELDSLVLLEYLSAAGPDRPVRVCGFLFIMINSDAE